MGRGAASHINQRGNNRESVFRSDASRIFGDPDPELDEFSIHGSVASSDQKIHKTARLCLATAKSNPAQIGRGCFRGSLGLFAAKLFVPVFDDSDRWRLFFGGLGRVRGCVGDRHNEGSSRSGDFEIKCTSPRPVDHFRFVRSITKSNPVKLHCELGFRLMAAPGANGSSVGITVASIVRRESCSFVRGRRSGAIANYSDRLTVAFRTEK